jgi:hypothetical protein
MSNINLNQISHILLLVINNLRMVLLVINNLRTVLLVINNLRTVTNTNKNIPYDIYKDTKDVLNLRRFMEKKMKKELKTTSFCKVLSFSVSLIITHSTLCGYPFRANFRKNIFNFTIRYRNRGVCLIINQNKKRGKIIVLTPQFPVAFSIIFWQYFLEIFIEIFIIKIACPLHFLRFNLANFPSKRKFPSKIRGSAVFRSFTYFALLHSRSVAL